jgi:hypothetical protein
VPDVLWLHYSRPRSGWYELDAPARDGHLARFAAARRDSVESGGQCQGSWHVRGNSDYSTVETWLFPDPDAAFTHWIRLTEAGYPRWFAFANNIGLRA